MQKLRHHHIASVQFHVFEHDTYSIIMLPVAECDLHHFLRRCIDAKFPRTELAHLTPWFGCLVGALAFAHSKHIKHEDIKPSNVLIKDHQPYLTDFGCAKDFSGLDSSTLWRPFHLEHWCTGLRKASHEDEARTSSLMDVSSAKCSQSDTNGVWKNSEPSDMFNIATMPMLSGRTWTGSSTGWTRPFPRVIR
jgi:serine/threonine protein kinase